MNEKVVHLATRKPLEEVTKAEMDAALEEMAERDAAFDEDQKVSLELLEKLKILVENGRLTGLIVLGLDPMTDSFLNEMRLQSPAIGPGTLFAYMGLLETLKLEIADTAMMAPVMSADGEIIDPYDDGDEE